jgi:hypothetical protein
MQSSLLGSDPGASLRQLEAPTFLGSLSVAGLSILIHSFGASKGAYYPGKSNIWSRANTTDHWRQVVGRGMARLREWASGTDVEPVVNLPLLRRMAKPPFTPFDISVARDLLSGIAKREKPTSQLSLDLQA